MDSITSTQIFALLNLVTSQEVRFNDHDEIACFLGQFEGKQRSFDMYLCRTSMGKILGVLARFSDREEDYIYMGKMRLQFLLEEGI